MNMSKWGAVRYLLWGAAAVALVLLPVAAYSAAASDPLAAGLQKKGKGGGGGGGSSLVADVVMGDFFSDGGTPLVSAGPAATSKGYAVLFKHTRCGDITPEGSSYALTDENRIETTVKRGQITRVRFWAQDVIGEEGIAHETDWVTIDPPAPVSKSGFTLHVHADNLQVWQLDGLRDGNRVQIIGTISIGDVVYRSGTAGDCN